LTEPAATERSFPVASVSEIKDNVLNWLRTFSTFCFLDSHAYCTHPGSYDLLVGAGVRRSFRSAAGSALDGFMSFRSEAGGWLFGHLGYELKDEIESLYTQKEDRIGFPDLCFFEPEILLRLSSGILSIQAADPDQVYRDIRSAPTAPVVSVDYPPIRQRFSREEYLDAIRTLKSHIAKGDCYEVNFCQEFYASGVRADPFGLYRSLSAASPNPFSAFYRTGDQWLICASPERFLRKTGQRILSQPIKGTTRRITDDPVADARELDMLRTSPKERTENIMVVDLVRNDLSRVCSAGTVQVDELCSVYSFPQVHHLVSTVSGTLRDGISLADIFRATFPMGSMTGAPKVRVMQLIDTYERSRRGLFSGALGYFDPAGDFDFNVVIRSVLFNSATGYLSYQAGSGITHSCDPEREWEECRIKAAAIERIVQRKG
jgi:para-aminobenzoate synthetase component 1